MYEKKSLLVSPWDAAVTKLPDSNLVTGLGSRSQSQDLNTSKFTSMAGTQVYVKVAVGTWKSHK